MAWYSEVSSSDFQLFQIYYFSCHAGGSPVDLKARSCLTAHVSNT